MIYAIPQSEHAISELQVEIKKAEKVKWYRRLKVIQLSMAGDTVPHLAEQFDVCPATVRAHIKAYNSGGIEPLMPQKQPGRPPKVGQLKKEEWQEILKKTPNQYDKLKTDSRQWTLELLVGYAKEYLGEEVVFQTISLAMSRCGFRTGRSKLRVGSPDPEYTVKRARVEHLRSLPQRGN